MTDSPPGVPKPIHISVMPRETIQQLQLEPGLTVVDGTTGAGGHSEQIAAKILPGGRLLCLDRDPGMLNFARQKVRGEHVHFANQSYRDLPARLDALEWGPVDRILLDLGFCSDQLEDESRGFSFRAKGPLDLRFDVSRGESAASYLARCSPEELLAVLKDYGEIEGASRLAEQLAGKTFHSAADFAETVARSLGNSRRGPADRHPATQVFQALRIAVNEEFSHLVEALNQSLPAAIKPGGRIAVITFHSLEDRLVKQAFQQSYWSSALDKPLCPLPAEVRYNPRSRSAKLRVAVRTEVDSPGLRQGCGDGARNKTGSGDGGRPDRGF